MTNVYMTTVHPTTKEVTETQLSNNDYSDLVNVVDRLIQLGFTVTLKLK